MQPLERNRQKLHAAGAKVILNKPKKGDAAVQTKETAREFLRRHDMLYEQQSFEELTNAYIADFRAGLRGERSTLMMLPSFLPAVSSPCTGESVLVLDAGGTNLRAGRIRFDNNGTPVVEALQKRRMPGTDSTVTADEMFRTIAATAFAVAGEAKYACIAFSFPCESLPGGDGRILSMGKESRVIGAEGRLVCDGIETALRSLGAPAHRRWRLINDTVGSMLGGMASCDRSRYADFIGFILGTGTNACCHVAASAVTKSPETAAMGGETIVNLESGGFGGALRGTADVAVDAASEQPGDHPAEKMISGAYYRRVLHQTLRLAEKEGLLSGESGKAIAGLTITSAMVDAFCLSPAGGNAIADALATPADRAFAAEINDLLLERAARIGAACLCAILHERALPEGNRTGICADGTMLRLNPVLRPRMEAYIAEYTAQHRLGGAEFLFAGDATLLGCAWAALA